MVSALLDVRAWLRPEIPILALLFANRGVPESRACEKPADDNTQLATNRGRLGLGGRLSLAFLDSVGGTLDYSQAQTNGVTD